MPLYYIILYEVWTRTVVVEATHEEDAQRVAYEGKGKERSFRYECLLLAHTQCSSADAPHETA